MLLRVCALWLGLIALSGTASGGPAASSWTISGRPMPFVRWSYAAEARATEARKATRRSRLTEAHLESLAEFAVDVERATIPVERSRAALLLVAGIKRWDVARSVFG